jgi:hypothetical protein
MKMSYYIYNEWKHNGHLQLVQKSKDYKKLDFKYLKEWHKPSTFHLVKANHSYSAQACIRVKNLGWKKDRLPSSYKCKYLRKIVHLK